MDENEITITFNPEYVHSEFVEKQSKKYLDEFEKLKSKNSSEEEDNNATIQR